MKQLVRSQLIKTLEMFLIANYNYKDYIINGLNIIKDFRIDLIIIHKLI